MAELSCDLMDIGQAAAGCEEQFAGIGNQIYVALRNRADRFLQLVTKGQKDTTYS